MKYKGILVVVVFCLILGGCKMRSDQVDESNKYEESKYFIPVQEYTGKEYPANEKKERWEYIEEHKEGIEAAAIGWFKNKYNFDVKVNHIYPRNGALIAIVEWLSDSNLKMPIVMGYNENSKEITGLQLTAMQLDNTIMSYIVYKIYETEFKKLDVFLTDFCKENGLYGLTDEYIANMGAFAGHTDNFFYQSSSSTDYKSTLHWFIENPLGSTQELRNCFEKDVANIERKTDKEVIDTNIMISLYSSNDVIDENIFKKLEKSLLSLEGIPDFNYLLILNKNSVDIRTDMSTYKTYPYVPTETGYLRIETGY